LIRIGFVRGTVMVYLIVCVRHPSQAPIWLLYQCISLCECY
jgi:hypothetical protein